MFTKTTVLNYMRGTGGEFFLNLLHDTSHSRPELYEKTNRYIFPDTDLKFQIMFQSWADAIHAGFDNVDDYLFFSVFDENLKRYDNFKQRYPGIIINEVLEESKKITFEQYCAVNLQKINGNVFPTHYRYSHITPIKKFLPNTNVIKLITSNVDINYFRLLFICKFLLCQPANKFSKQEVLEYVYDDMFFDRFCPFDVCYSDEICIDAYDLYFKRSKKINGVLSDIADKRINLNFDLVKKYTDDNLKLVKKHFNYDISKGTSDEKAKDLFLSFIELNTHAFV